MQIVLFQPDIAGNVGSIIRLAACFNVKLNIILPCGFPFDTKKIRRSALDYIDHVKLLKHDNWLNFIEYKNTQYPDSRIILFTTKSQESHYNHIYQKNDILLFGSESSGVPEFVHKSVEQKLSIIMQNNMRSLNLAMSVAMALGEANKINL
mgnify:CR=1 FL=1|jgi:tRNA (cytidine/uridine-2'-O-)-methyltransferase